MMLHVSNKVHAKTVLNNAGLQITVPNGKLFFFVSEPKQMLWVLKRTVSMRRFFCAPKTYAKIDG